MKNIKTLHHKSSCISSQVDHQFSFIVVWRYLFLGESLVNSFYNGSIVSAGPFFSISPLLATFFYFFQLVLCRTYIMGGRVRKELHLSYVGPSGPIELDCTCSLLVGENSPSSSAGVVPSSLYISKNLNCYL